MYQSHDAEEPMLIAVLGVTGAGKTTFISKVTGKTNMKIGHGMDSCTQNMELADMVLDNRKILLIDTPGFDDTHKSDADILELIAKHLSGTYEAGKLLSGIILLQPITGNRVAGSERKRTRLFEQICGPNAFQNVVIATTFWGDIEDKAKGIAREEERIQRDDFWGKMVKGGARTARHANTKQSAIDIVRMVANKPQVVLQMQSEMAANGCRWGDTSAGQELDKELNEKCAGLMRELAATREEATRNRTDLMGEIKDLQLKIDLIEEQNEQIQKSSIVWSEAAVEKIKSAFNRFKDFSSEYSDVAIDCTIGGAAVGGVAMEVVLLAPLLLACVVM